MRLLWRSSQRYLLRHPWLMLLSILGVAIGVAVVVAIDLANVSAERAFSRSADAVTGTATHRVVGAAGQLDEAVYRQLRVDLGVRDAAPVVEGYASAEGRTVQLLGVDPLAEAPFRPYVGGDDDSEGVDLGLFIATPRTALLATPTAEALGVGLDDSLRLSLEGQEAALRIVGLVTPTDDYSEQALDNLVVLDIGTAQALLGRAGTLSHVDLILPDTEAGQAELQRLQEALPAGVEIVRSSSRTETLAQMTRAFSLNLTALSLLALVVGMFLIYNTMTFSVVQRRSLIGRLRALGVTRRQVFGLIVGEALVIGLAGTVLGLAVGYVLAQGLVQLVTQTINDLYYVLAVRSLTIAPWTLAKGVLLGLGATVVAALWPAREATSAPPSAVLRRSEEEATTRARIPYLAGAGVALGLLGVGLLLIPSRSIVLSYGAMLSVLLAFALLTPGAVLLTARGLRPLMGRLFGMLGRMSARGLVTALSRTAVAIAALTVAVAATVGVGVMVNSFRQTVVVWLDFSLQADIYVQPPSLVFRRGTATLDPALTRQLAEAPGVAASYTVRGVEVRTDQGLSDLVAISPSGASYRSFRFKEGTNASVWPTLDDGNAVIISEPYSYRYELGVGDSLRIQTDRGPRTYAITGVFYDYGSDVGTIMMSRTVYEQVFDDRGVSGLALYAADGQGVDALVDRLRNAYGTEQDLIIRSNRSLREVSMEIFDRTFTITSVLRLLAVIVAFIGVLSALMALQLERAREFAVLRATGLTPRQVWRYITLQTGLMGLVAGLLALPLGLALAYVLTFVINKRSFGWTLQFEVGPEVLLQAVALAVVAALLAGLYPAYRMAQANPALALRDEG
ncbi:MAG: FtsX-like permease family protein [Bacteroidota bacterium]